MIADHPLLIADRDIPFLAGVPEPYARVEWRAGAEISVQEVRDADALVVRTRTHCDEALLAGSRVRMIATATIGHDHIDTDYCRARGIAVATAAGCNARGVLQWMGAVLRALGTPAGRVLGVVGVGNVGSLVVESARRWGFEAMGCDPFREGFATLDEVARRADIVTFHVPLTRTGPHPTFRMAGAEFFARMKPGAILVNSSRGEVVDGAALLAAHRAKGIDYVLDVWPDEPRISPELLQKSLLATPHIAGYTLQGKANATAMSVQALARHFGWQALENWRPEQVAEVVPRNISWKEMAAQMPTYFDIEALSDALKSHPENFEPMRNHYDFRTEFF